MNLVIIDARPEQTARAQRLTPADRAVIEESADGATAWAAGDTGGARAFVRDCGQRNRWAPVAKWHDVGSSCSPASLAQQHFCQQGHHRRDRESHPVPHGRFSLVSIPLSNIPLAPSASQIARGSVKRAFAEPSSGLLEEQCLRLAARRRISEL
jgi:hypothetical protein